MSFYNNYEFTKPLEVVCDYVEQYLRLEKLAQKKQELVAELKKKYTIVDNIDYEYYTSQEFIESINAENRQ